MSMTTSSNKREAMTIRSNRDIDNILAKAEQEIEKKFGMRIYLQPKAVEYTKKTYTKKPRKPQFVGKIDKLPLNLSVLVDVEKLMKLVAQVCKQPVSAYTEVIKIADIVRMRKIATKLIKDNYPTYTLKKIGDLFGGQDHTTIKYNVDSTRIMIKTRNTVFCEQYQECVIAINEYVKKKYGDRVKYIL